VAKDKNTAEPLRPQRNAKKTFNPKTEIEPRITRIYTDYEEAVETIFIPV
jgi:hypothetical protein